MSIFNNFILTRRGNMPTNVSFSPICQLNIRPGGYHTHHTLQLARPWCRPLNMFLPAKNFAASPALVANNLANFWPFNFRLKLMCFPSHEVYTHSWTNNFKISKFLQPWWRKPCNHVLKSLSLLGISCRLDFCVLKTPRKPPNFLLQNLNPPPKNPKIVKN